MGEMRQFFKEIRVKSLRGKIRSAGEVAAARQFFILNSSFASLLSGILRRRTDVYTEYVRSLNKSKFSRTKGLTALSFGDIIYM